MQSHLTRCDEHEEITCAHDWVVNHPQCNVGIHFAEHWLVLVVPIGIALLVRGGNEPGVTRATVIEDAVPELPHALRDDNDLLRVRTPWIQLGPFHRNVREPDEVERNGASAGRKHVMKPQPFPVIIHPCSLRHTIIH